MYIRNSVVFPVTNGS